MASLAKIVSSLVGSFIMSIVILGFNVLWEWGFRTVHLDKKTRAKLPINWRRFIITHWIVIFVILAVISIGVNVGWIS